MSSRKRRSSPSSSSSSRCPELTDFERFKPKLTKIFFREEDFIQHGSQEYKDFWKFLRQYQAMKEKVKKSKDAKRSKDSGKSSDLTICFQLCPKDPKDLLNRISFQDYDDPDNVLTEDMLMEFRHILTLYLEFLQKEKFAKLKKLRESQANLPIAEYRHEILKKVKENQIVIIAGDTGCGKSTQVPQYLLQEGYENIACTQPRRIACISLAKRVGYETLNEFGSEIGYQIRFERQKTDKTRVLFLTEGLLLRQITTDPSLSMYNVIILDEVHERHLHGDFLLGVVKCLVQQREDIKIILMSATINISLFQNYFHGSAPVIQVPGRLYPIKLQYHPIPAIEQSSSEKLNPAPYVRILQLINKKYPDSERGDVLIFMSGIKEITSVVDACKEYAEKENKWIVLPLHSTLSLAEQDKVFDYAPEGTRKCIVSTNIAETSITIDGVRFVVDSGKVKEMQYDPVCKMRRLKEFWISRASAEQRKGRSGRTGPGVCFRLYGESEYKMLAPYSTPEIHRVPLDSLILQMISMGLPDARKFPFIEPPPAESIENSIIVLKEQGALNEDETLTITGRMLSNLPVDVSLGKMLIMGSLFHQIESVLSLAAALSVQSPFTNNAYKDQDCVAARRNLDSDHGDPITLLNSYREWLQIKAENRESSRKWCKKRGLEEQRFYEMTKLRAQFKELLEQSGLLKRDEERESSSRMTSSERANRHGELKHLRNLKKEYYKNEEPRKKKVLKIHSLSDFDEDERGGNKIDLKDIEFRMRNDSKKVQVLLDGTKAYSYKDLTILKLILTSGLYPQIAVGDDFNTGKSGADLLYHTKVKPFNVLHPNGIFSTSPEYLTLESMDIASVAGFPSKHPVSSKHQVLVYLSLLETNKPYLMNVLRMPCLQTLLLYSRNIDINGTFARIVFDSWLELRFPDPDQALILVYRASILRQYWTDLLTLKLQATLDEVADPVAAKEKQEILEQKLARGLIDFMHSETLFSMKRLLPGDLKILYCGHENGKIDIEENPFRIDQSIDNNIQSHSHKGGLMLNDYVVYNCLENTGDDIEMICKDWKCPLCGVSLYSSPLSRLNHFAKCEQKEVESKLKEDMKELREKEKISNPLAKEYFCEKCNKTLQLVPTDILKHKKSHS